MTTFCPICKHNTWNQEIGVCDYCDRNDKWREDEKLSKKELSFGRR